MKSIITIQHTQSVQHTNGMIGSWTDWDLTEFGIEQAKRIGKCLSQEIKNERYIMYSSDLLRTKHTAEIIASFLGIEPIFTNILREFNFGEACGKSKQWASENGKSKIVPYCKRIDERPFKNAETIREVWNRIIDFYNQIVEKTDNNIIVVSHGGTLGMFYAIWLGLDVEMFYKYELRSNAGGVSFLYEDENGKRIINRLNDRSYIRIE